MLESGVCFPNWIIRLNSLQFIFARIFASTLSMSHLAFPSAIVCACGKRFDSAWSADATTPPSAQPRNDDSNGSALWLFLRHRAARLAKRSLTSKPHQAEFIMMQCAYCRESIVADVYGVHVRYCRRGGIFSRPKQSDTAYHQSQNSNDDPSFHCYGCKGSDHDDESERLDADATFIRHCHQSGSYSFELFMSCRECRGRVPLCDAIGHAAFFHPERLSNVADLFLAVPSPAADSDSVQIDATSCEDPSTVRETDPAAAIFDVPIDEETPTDLPISDGGAPPSAMPDPDAPATAGWPFFECDCCGRLFHMPEDLERHSNLHEPPRIHRCHECGKSFSNRHAIRAHISNCHVERRYRCEKCDKRFPVNSALIMHRRTHTGEKPFACTQCVGERRSFRNTSGLAVHLARVHGIGGESCGVCDKRFYNRQKLEEHRRMHSGERPNACATCGKAFARSNNLKLHSTIHISGSAQSFGCKLCGKHFRTRGNVTQHQGSMVHKAKAAAAALEAPAESAAM